jgi:hypothetical protein
VPVDFCLSIGNYPSLDGREHPALKVSQFYYRHYRMEFKMIEEIKSLSALRAILNCSRVWKDVFGESVRLDQLTVIPIHTTYIHTVIYYIFNSGKLPARLSQMASVFFFLSSKVNRNFCELPPFLSVLKQKVIFKFHFIFFCLQSRNCIATLD